MNSKAEFHQHPVVRVYRTSLESWQVAEEDEDSRSMSLEQTNFFVSGLSLFVLIVCDFDFGINCDLMTD